VTATREIWKRQKSIEQSLPQSICT